MASHRMGPAPLCGFSENALHGRNMSTVWLECRRETANSKSENCCKSSFNYGNQENLGTIFVYLILLNVVIKEFVLYAGK